MCGFTIILNKKNKKIKKNIKEKIIKSQSHRGPDYSKYIEKDRIIFFHNRLSVIDLST